MTATAKPSAKVIALPGAAPEPVRQHPRRGRFPATVAPIGRGRLIRLKAGTSAATVPGKGDDARQALETAERFYPASKHLHAAAPASAVDLAAVLVVLGRAIAEADDLTRKQAKPIIDQLFNVPTQAAELGRRLVDTLALTQRARARSTGPA